MELSYVKTPLRLTYVTQLIPFGCLCIEQVRDLHALVWVSLRPAQGVVPLGMQETGLLAALAP